MICLPFERIILSNVYSNIVPVWKIVKTLEGRGFCRLMLFYKLIIIYKPVEKSQDKCIRNSV